MAVKIRLSRVGRKDVPMYRVVATDERVKRDGKVLANVGTYDAQNGRVIQFHEEIYNQWLKCGAQVTDAAKKVHKLFKRNGVYVWQPTAKIRLGRMKQTVEVAAPSTE